MVKVRLWLRTCIDLRRALVEEEIRYSDALMVLLLKGAKPEKYADRIKYVHLKDWDPSLPPEMSGQGGTAVIKDFVELGQGRVDLKGCVEVLRRRGYDGWLTIELDYTRRTPWESVEMSKDYLVNELKLTT